jgi:uncharacterized protein YkwD
MKIIILLFAISLLSSLKVFSQDYHQKFYIELNKIRAKHLKPRVERDTVLEKECEIHLQKMIKKWNGAMVHGSMSDPNNTFKTEVLAQTYDSSYLVAWLNHKSHREHLLNRKARKVGLCVIGELACARLSD